MYPNATVNGNGGGADDWKTKLPQGFDKSKIPSGANGVIKDGEIYIFTKDGEALQNGKYNADGSVFTGSSATGGGGTQGTGATDALSEQLARQYSVGGYPSAYDNSVFSNSGGSYSSGYGSVSGGSASAGFDIDPDRLMQSANMLQNLTYLSGSVPFGLGGLFSQGALASVMQSFMNALSFNFDFSKFNFQATPATTTTTTTTSRDTEGSDGVPDGYVATDHDGVFLKDGKFYKYNDSNELVECKADGSETTTSTSSTTTSTTSTTTTSTTARRSGSSDSTTVPKGYTKTTVEGVFKKGNQYYQYAADGKTLVECTRDGKQSVPKTNSKTSSPAPKFMLYNSFIDTNNKKGLITKDKYNSQDDSHEVTVKDGTVYKFDKDGHLVKQTKGGKTVEYTYASKDHLAISTQKVTEGEFVTTTKYEKLAADTSVQNRKQYISNLQKSGITDIDYQGSDVISYTQPNGAKVRVKFSSDGTLQSKTVITGETNSSTYSEVTETYKNGYKITSNKALTAKARSNRSQREMEAEAWQAQANMPFK